MNKSFAANRIALSLIIPMAMFISIIFLIRSSLFPVQSEMVSLAITIDLLITIPLIYFFINRKTNIPNTTVIAVIAIGALIGTYFLPQGNQQYLDFFKLWFIPVIEIFVLGYIAFKIRSAIKNFKASSSGSSDFYTAIKETCYTFLPPKLVIPFAMEVAVIYYGFISWRQRPFAENEFSYHKNSSTQAILGAVILISFVEVFAIHFLLSKWSIVAAWILTGLSLYTILQIWGLIKSLSRRPISIDENRLHLHYGILNEATIELNDIESLELSSKDLEEDSEIKIFSPLGKLEGHNIIIHLKNENELSGFYGIKKKFKALAFHVDDVNLFEIKFQELIKD